MHIHKAGHEINSIDDWFRWAPPKRGTLHWKDGRSAKELAKSWFRSGSAMPPRELESLLEATFGPLLFKEIIPECIAELDDFGGEGRNCDLVAVCEVAGQRIVISVEAKADERFGPTVGDYYDQKVGSRSNVPARIEQLSEALFGRQPDGITRRLRYQLIHAAAASLIEAKNHNATCGVLLIHEFVSAPLSARRLEQNASDWANFVRAFPELTAATVDKNQILGPVSVHGGRRVPTGIPLYLGKLRTML
jgi:hypothetical protein